MESLKQGDIVSVMYENAFFRGKVTKDLDKSIRLQTGQTKETENFDFAKIKVGDTFKFKEENETIKATLTKKEGNEITLKSGTGNVHKNVLDMPQKVTLVHETIKTFRLDDEKYQGAYKFNQGQKYDIREVPSKIFGLNTKDIPASDMHKLLKGNQTENVYTLTKRDGEKYEAKFSFKRSEGKLRIDVNPKNQTLNLSDKFTAEEKKELLSGGVIVKDFQGKNKSFQSFVKVDEKLNKLSFLPVNELVELNKKTKLNLSNEHLNKLAEKGKLDLGNANKKFSVSLDFHNKTLQLKKEKMVTETKSFKLKQNIPGLKNSQKI